MKTKVCNACKSRRSVNMFWKNKNTCDGYQNYCKICMELKYEKMIRVKRGTYIQLQKLKIAAGKGTSYSDVIDKLLEK